MPFLRGPLKVLHFFHILCKNYEFSVAGIGGNWGVSFGRIYSSKLVWWNCTLFSLFISCPVTSSKYLVLRLFHHNKTLRKCFSVFCCFYFTALFERPWCQQMCQQHIFGPVLVIHLKQDLNMSEMILLIWSLYCSILHFNPLLNFLTMLSTAWLLHPLHTVFLPPSLTAYHCWWKAETVWRSSC